VLALVADHGESWGERLDPSETLDDVFDLHGNHLHDEVIRVPWIVHAPSLVRPVVVGGLARTVDLMPTLVELLELDPAPVHAEQPAFARSGRSLACALDSGRVADGALAFCSRNRDFVASPRLPSAPGDVYVELACRDRTTRVIADFSGDRARCYDLIADPGELHPADVANSASTPLARALHEEKGTAVVAPHDPADFARMTRQLRDLEYL